MSGPLPHSKATQVAANRDARVTWGQLVALVYSGAWRILLGLPAAAIGAAMAWGAPGLGGEAGGIGTFFFLAFGIGLLGTGAYGAWRGFSFLGDALTRKVSYVTGRVDRDTRTYKGSTFYYMTVGPVRTGISHKTYSTLPLGTQCHAYYAPGSLHLLSIEPATVAEPHPSLSFGGDAAHAWDRLRWPWLVGAVAVFGLAAGANGVVTAHQAQTSRVVGSISEYREFHGKHDSYFLHLEGDQTEYNLNQVAAAGLPQLYSFTGENVDLYVSTDNGIDVLALRLRETLYQGDLYLHPQNEYWAMAGSGIAIILLSGLTLATIVWGRYRTRGDRPAGLATHANKRAPRKVAAKEVDQ